MNALSLNLLSHALIGAALEVHLELGPGLLESAYHAAYSHELALREIPHVRQQDLPIVYKGILIESGYCPDMLAGQRVIVELKAIDRPTPLLRAQLLTYVRLGGYPLGLLVNFNVSKLAEGIEWVSNDALDPAAVSACSALISRSAH